MIRSAALARVAAVLLVLTALALTAGCNKREVVSLEFPPDQSLGQLALIEESDCFTCGNGFQALGEARGTRQIELPGARWFVSLRMPAEAGRLLTHLTHPTSAHLGMLDLSGSDVTDDDLAVLSTLRLRELNLSDTAITGAGLTALKPHPVWSAIRLKGCRNLEPAFLKHFNGWDNATITLPYPANDPRRRLAERAICAEQTGSACQTQIRY